MYECVCVCMYVCMCVCMYVCMYECGCVWMCMYVYDNMYDNGNIGPVGSTASIPGLFCPVSRSYLGSRT